MKQLIVELLVKYAPECKKEVCIMKATEFKDWIKSIERMSRGQRDKLRERLERKAGADTIIELIEQGQSDELSGNRAVSLGQSK